ncbi:ATP/GTP-binding protein [Methylorubrum extorquens]|uniref:ATP/GTP-binding protein n=1 Tax=Methylorubrum extorquens TaxID=408 RepID=UPI003F60D9D4
MNLNRSPKSCSDGENTVRVVITGSHGVGKTTLAASLLTNIGAGNAAIVPETARLLVAEGFAVNDQMTLEGFLRYIQLFSQNARQTGGDVVIFDRSLIDLHVYTRDIFSIPEFAHNLLLELIRYELLLIDAYIIVPIEFALAADGVRPIADTYQRKIDHAVRHFLSVTGAPILEVSGSLTDRTHQVIEYLGRTT